MIKFIILFFFSGYPNQEREVGTIDIVTNSIPGKIYFSSINLRDFTAGDKSIDQISEFGQVTEKTVHETPAETDYFYSFDGFKMIFAQLSQTPELIELRSSNPDKSLEFKNLKILPGQHLDDLTVPFQIFAREHKVLPEFGTVPEEKITYHPSGTSSIRIVYDLDTELIREVIFLGSSL
jgi:hypothetical protein